MSITNLNDYRELRKYRRIADRLLDEQSRLPVYPVTELSPEDLTATERAIRELMQHHRNIQMINEINWPDGDDAA